MRTMMMLCAAPLIVLWSPIAGKAAPQDSPVVLTDTSSTPPDMNKNKKKKKDGKKIVTLLSSSYIENKDKKLQQETPQQFSVKEANYQPICLDIAGANSYCDPTLLSCLSNTSVSLLKDYANGAASYWSLATNSSVIFSWDGSNSKRVQVNTGVNVVQANPANPKAIQDLYLGSYFTEGDVTVNSGLQKFLAAPGANLAFTVNYCKVTGNAINCGGKCGY